MASGINDSGAIVGYTGNGHGFLQDPNGGITPIDGPLGTQFIDPLDINDAGAIRIQVPYHSQLDGTPWAEANCGPTSLSMALEALGVKRSSAELRAQALDAQSHPSPRRT